MQVLIMCKSLTNAQRGALLLERQGISASVIKAPQHLRSNGCGYALSLYRHFREACELLKKYRLLGGKLYRREELGEYREVLEDDLP